MTWSATARGYANPPAGDPPAGGARGFSLPSGRQAIDPADAGREDGPKPLRLGVVIPTRATRELVLACLASLPEAGGGGVRVVVVDDGGGDDTAAAIAAAHPQVHVLAHERPQGYSAAAETGLAALDREADVLVVLNSDTEVGPGGFDLLVAAFAANRRLGVAGARLVYPDGRPQWSAGRRPTRLWLFALASGLPAWLGRFRAWRRWKPVGSGGPREKRLGEERREGGEAPVSVDWVAGAALAVRREAWREVGPFDPRFRFYGQDLDLCLRAGEAGWEVAVVPGFAVVHHLGGTVARTAGDDAHAGQHLALLWGDLVRWADKEGGAAGARRAARALAAGASVRLAGRALAGAFLSPSQLPVWRAESAAIARARTAAAEAAAEAAGLSAAAATV